MQKRRLPVHCDYFPICFDRFSSVISAEHRASENPFAHPKELRTLWLNSNLRVTACLNQLNSVHQTRRPSERLHLVTIPDRETGYIQDAICLKLLCQYRARFIVPGHQRHPVKRDQWQDHRNHNS